MSNNIENPFPNRKDISKISSSTLIRESDYSDFPDRKDILTKKLQDGDGFDRDLSVTSLEAQREFLWTRVYLKEELEIHLDDEIKIKYLPTNEELVVKFICYNKKGLHKNDDDLVQYSNEDDTKVLCLQSDLDRIDRHSDDIKFIRTLFKKSMWFEYQVFRKDDLIVEYNNKQLEYIFIDF